MSGPDFELTDSLGRYVLVIYELISEEGVARSKDIARLVGVSRPSVTGALQKLARSNLIEYEPYGNVKLTNAGIKSARSLLLKHRATFDFLTHVLGVSDTRSDAVAAEIEQHLPGDVLCRLVQFTKWYNDNESFQFKWSAACGNLCRAVYGLPAVAGCVEATAAGG